MEHSTEMSGVTSCWLRCKRHAMCTGVGLKGNVLLGEVVQCMYIMGEGGSGMGHDGGGVGTALYVMKKVSNLGESL